MPAQVMSQADTRGPSSGPSCETDLIEFRTRFGIVSNGYQSCRPPGKNTAADMIPSEFNPEVVIEPKLIEDDGTARE